MANNSRRVRWLERAYKMLREDLLQDAPAKACVSVSVTTRKQAIGQHFPVYKGPDGHDFLAIHPRLFTDPIQVLKTLLHEMVHATAPPKSGHKKPFQVIAKATGLTPPWTATGASEGLLKKLQKMAEKLGPLPRAEWLTQEVPVLAAVELECLCPRTLMLTEEFVKGGNVKCMKCHKLFRRKKK